MLPIKAGFRQDREQPRKQWLPMAALCIVTGLIVDAACILLLCLTHVRK